MQIQLIKTDKYRSNSEVLHREDLLFLKVTKHTKSESFLHNLCDCPDVMSCDDDIFQHFVLGSLVNSEEFKQSKCQKKVSFYCSGESLIEEFLNFQAKCRCEGPHVIITDYHMGDGKMNGVEVALKLRSLGYKKGIVLRTSNSIESLRDEHSDIDRLLERGIINCFLSKANLKKQREELSKYFVSLP